jgi:uncharacterized protein YndB with AHSA1/START domain
MKAERSLVIAAEQERVWRAITTPEIISRWFDGTMRWSFRLAAGETITLTMPDFTGYAHIAIVEPPEHFAFTWTPEPGNPAETLVTFRLEAVPGGTRVTATEDRLGRRLRGAARRRAPEALRHDRIGLGHHPRPPDHLSGRAP